MNIFSFFFPIKIKSSAKTDRGKKREQNEDSILEDTKNHFYVVADGIGGHGRGDYASSQSIKIVEEYLFNSDTSSQTEMTSDQISQINFENAADIGSNKYPQIKTLFHGLNLANQKIYSENQNTKTDDEKKRGMGTTFSGCWFLEKQKKVILFNIGDSRIYLLRNSKLIQRSHDHSMLQHWIDNGKQGKKPASNIILRAIGPCEEIEVDIELADIKRGDTWLICSDGLHGMLKNKTIEEFINQRVSDKSLSNHANYANRLVDKANYAGGLDNVSAVIIHIM